MRKTTHIRKLHKKEKSYPYKKITEIRKVMNMRKVTQIMNMRKLPKKNSVCNFCLSLYTT